MRSTPRSSASRGAPREPHPRKWDGLLRFDDVFGPGAGQVPASATIVSAAEVGAASAALPLGPKTLDVTASLAAWSADPSANHGWIFRPNGTSGGGFRSSEYTTASERPKLVVVFAPPEP